MNLLIIAMALVGHGGLHVAMYNRINSLGWQRKTIKRIVKVFLLSTMAIPLLFLISQSAVLPEVLLENSPLGRLDRWVQIYGTVCLGSWILLGIPWLIFRPLFRLESANASRSIEVVDVASQFSHSLTLSTKAKWESRLPLNQVLELSVEQIELPVPGLPEQLDGYRIAHLSDIHLTGEIHPDYARYVVQRANEARPDLIALTGDIIDKQPCIDWLADIFSPAEAVDGCYFILGNHDTRIVDSWETRDAMDRAGWIDLGSEAIRRDLAGVPSLLLGNEYPWFERPDVQLGDESFRLLLSHSPDQFGWARRHQVHLMLAGHTHGGQGRLPLAGPILSPSVHGSRYASGDFYRSPTTLHVTRGLGGVHLVRINCRPELSILTLRCPGP